MTSSDADKEYVVQMNALVHGSLATLSTVMMAYFLGRIDKIMCIKMLRENTHWGLKEAKDYVDACQRLMEMRGWRNIGL